MRIAHWVLVVGFVAVYVSSVDQRAGRSNLHIWIGYAIGGIVLWRALWGFVGPRYARFSDFVFSRTIVFNYFKDVFLGSPRRYLGHSPAGGAIIMGLMTALGASAVTGIAAYGGFGGGVLAHVLRALHEAMAILAVILAILHVLGITIASITHRENLIAAMFSGKKRLED